MPRPSKNKPLTLDDLAAMVQTGFSESATEMKEFRDEVGEKFTQVNTRFDTIETRLNAVESKVDALIDVTLIDLKKRVSSLESSVVSLQGHR